MYPDGDPRNGLAAARPASQFGQPQLVELRTTTPSHTTAAGSSVWYVRTASFLVAYYELAAGDTVDLLPALADRVVVVPHDEERVRVRLDSPSDAASWTADGAGIAVVPGRAQVHADTAATVVEAASFDDLDGGPVPVNDAAYAAPVPGLAEPPARRVAGLQGSITGYPMSRFPPTEGRFGRIICSSNVMANLLETESGPRDVGRLSPHTHDGFEQCSITTRGRYVQRWRTPWTADLTSWREDQHPSYDSPGIAIIPPGVVHTANSTSAGPNQMIDLFSPPRDDFVARGWVLNRADSEL